jgi:glycosyltransferase involved in cell wall biosynthesis
MLRFSKNFKVIYVSGSSFRYFLKDLLHNKKLHSYEINDNLEVYVPFGLPTFQMRFSPAVYLNKILELMLVKRKIQKLKIKNPILWLYHPRYINTIGKFGEGLVVYDCMDDFTSLISLKEDRGKIERDEKDLLRKADIVFAGGYSIADLKRNSREHIHVFPSAVEIDHFKKALSDNIEIPGDIKDIPHPILGYWGAIDERIDHSLLESLALRHPDWSIVFLGPIVKHEIEDFPYLDKIKNVFWLGPKDYSLLPNYARAFDICLNPFVLTREGRHLSPTKTLEYLATGRPVVSTPINDVVRFYNGIVSIADGVEEFEMAIKRCMEEDNESLKQKRINFTENKTWENTVRKMEELILEKIGQRVL